MNILICSASAKIQLIELFQMAVRPLGGKVIAADNDPFCCARHFADAFVQLPSDSEPSFRAQFLAACKDHDICLVVPTRDGELPRLAALRDDLQAMGVVLPLPDPARLETCMDKLNLHAFCLKHGFPVLPISVPTAEPDFPVFARARAGAGSRCVFQVPDLAAWNAVPVDGADYIVQPYCRLPEYSCDVLLDLDGVPLQCVVRERQKTVGGESWRSQIVDLPVLEKLALDLCAALGLRGHNLVQLFHGADTGPYIIEVNPRLGGASPLSIHGGLASPERLVQMVMGHYEAARARRPVRTGLMSVRYSRDIFVDGTEIAERG